MSGLTTLRAAEKISIREAAPDHIRENPYGLRSTTHYYFVRHSLPYATYSLTYLGSFYPVYPRPVIKRHLTTSGRVVINDCSAKK